MADAATTRILINGREVHVAPGATLAAALLSAGISHFRSSVTGEPRSPLCAMGICYECRVTVNGAQHVKSCQLLCTDGMDVRTDG